MKWEQIPILISKLSLFLKLMSQKFCISKDLRVQLGNFLTLWLPMSWNNIIIIIYNCQYKLLSDFLQFFLQKHIFIFTHMYVKDFLQGFFGLPPTWIPLLYLYASMCPTAFNSFCLCILSIKSRRYEYFFLAFANICLETQSVC